MRKHVVFIILAAVLAAAGCGQDFGQVDQGRVIAYDKNENTIVMIRDKSPDPKKPDYTGLPPVTYSLPVNPAETGPAPAVGKLMGLDLDKKQAVIYNENLKNVESVAYTPMDQKKVEPKDPLVYDPTTQKTRKFPIIDPVTKTIMVYLEKKKTLLTFSVPDPYFSMPPETWAMGDEVRIYYKEPGKSLRYMNVSKTDIFKK